MSMQTADREHRIEMCIREYSNALYRALGNYAYCTPIFQEMSLEDVDRIARVTTASKF